LYFRKKIRKDLQTVSLNADMIRLLLAIDERKSLYQISPKADGICSSAFNLVEALAFVDRQ